MFNNWIRLGFIYFFPLSVSASHVQPTPHRLQRHTAWSRSLWGWSVWSLEVPLQRWQSTLWLTRYYRRPYSLQLTQHAPGYVAAPWPRPLRQPPTEQFPRGERSTPHTHNPHMPKAYPQPTPKYTRRCTSETHSCATGSCCRARQHDARMGACNIKPGHLIYCTLHTHTCLHLFTLKIQYSHTADLLRHGITLKARRPGPWRHHTEKPFQNLSTRPFKYNYYDDWTF